VTETQPPVRLLCGALACFFFSGSAVPTAHNVPLACFRLRLDDGRDNHAVRGGGGGGDGGVGTSARTPAPLPLSTPKLLFARRPRVRGRKLGSRPHARPRAAEPRTDPSSPWQRPPPYPPSSAFGPTASVFHRIWLMRIRPIKDNFRWAQRCASWPASHPSNRWDTELTPSMGLFEARGLLPNGHRQRRYQRGLRCLVPRVTRGSVADDSETRITHATSANQLPGCSWECTKPKGEVGGRPPPSLCRPPLRERGCLRPREQLTLLPLPAAARPSHRGDTSLQ